MKHKPILYFLIITNAIIVNIRAQSTKEYIKHLKKNSLNIEDTSLNWSNVLDPAFFENNFFWIGEAHGIKHSYDALWLLFKKIHQETGFKYFLLENGFISEIYLNRYLETGAESWLKAHFNATKGTLCRNKSAYEFFQKFYWYNQELPKEKRIKIVSIDIEHQYKETHHYLQSVFRKSTIESDTSGFIKKFLQASDDYKTIYNQLAKDISKDTLKYKTMLGKDFSDFCYMVRNINYYFTSRVSANWAKTRDSLLFENYKTRLRNHDFISSKVFAYFGTLHCYLKKTKELESIASLINRSNPKIKSTSILFYYADCKAIRVDWQASKKQDKPTGTGVKYITISFDEDITNIYKKLSKANLTLLNIKNTNASFRTARYLHSFVDGESPIKHYFDYFLLIKNSPATEPYD